MAITFEQLQEKFPFERLDPKEWHQHPKGNGWIQNTAHVDKSAHVEGIVYGNAQVYGDARVYGDAWAFSPLQIQGTKHFVNTSSHTTIAIGCSNYKIQKCTQESFAEVGKQNGYTPDQIAEYGIIITLCANWLKQKFPKENGCSINRDAKGRFMKRETK